MNSKLDTVYKTEIALISGIMPKNGLLPLLKEISPSLTPEELKEWESKSKEEILKYCFDENPSKTFRRALYTFVRQIRLLLESYLGAVGTMAVYAKTKEDFINRLNLFMYLRGEYKKELEATGALHSIDTILDWWGGSNVIRPPGPAEDTIPYTAQKFGETLQPPINENTILELLKKNEAPPLKNVKEEEIEREINKVLKEFETLITHV